VCVIIIGERNHHRRDPGGTGNHVMSNDDGRDCDMGNDIRIAIVAAVLLSRNAIFQV